MADPTQLHQIGMNLITNAYHAVEQTSGKISVQLKEIMMSADEIKDKDSYLQPGASVRLSVSDNGTGISPSLIRNIFEPYFTTKEQGKGTGMERLLLVDDEKSVMRLEKQMLERLGYKVDAHSSSIDALETFKNHPDDYDLVVTGMTMPNMTGDKLAKKFYP